MVKYRTGNETKKRRGRFGRINSFYMKDRRKRYIEDIKGTLRRSAGILEVLLITAVYYFVWSRIYGRQLFSAYFGSGRYLLCLLYAFIVFVLIQLCDGFEFGYFKLTDIIISQAVSIAVADLITYFQLCLIAGQMIAVWPSLLLLGLDWLACLFCCFLFTFVYHRIYVPQNMVMINGASGTAALKTKMDLRGDKYHISRVISADSDPETLRREILSHDAVILNGISGSARNDILKYCYSQEVRTYVVPGISDTILRGAQDITLFDTPLLLVKGTGLTVPQRAVKRLFDIVLCLIALIPFIPITLILAAAIWAEDRGPVFYLQERVTKDGKVFRMIKFRSMVVNAESYGSYTGAREDDPRITKVGRFIRAARLDELPQILNILKGDMSLVGPRPEHRQNTDAYTEAMPEFAYRLKVKGGLTGYAQIFGKYNTSPYDKLQLDLMYIENYSLLLDLKLILMTLRVMLKKESTEGFAPSDGSGEEKDG